VRIRNVNLGRFTMDRLVTILGRLGQEVEFSFTVHPRPRRVREVLSGIRTAAEMIEALRDEEQCRRLIEAMIWPHGRVCPACGYKRSIALAGRDMGRYRARPDLYQCSNGACCFQFTATTRTPLHTTKLPLSTRFKAWG